MTKVSVYGALLIVFSLVGVTAVRSFAAEHHILQRPAADQARIAMMGNGTMGGGMMDGGMMGGGRSRNAAPTTKEGGPGAAIFQRQCAACHTLQSGAPNGVGPNLHGLFGRKAAGAPGYSYSSAMRNANVTWDQQTISAFIESPQSVVPGNKMPFSGISDTRERRDLITYLKAATK